LCPKVIRPLLPSAASTPAAYTYSGQDQKGGLNQEQEEQQGQVEQEEVDEEALLAMGGRGWGPGV